MAFKFRRIARIAFLLCAILITLALLGAALAGGNDDLTVIEVPGGDVVSLYQAIYGQDGQPRDNVDIILEAGTFLLNPSQPFGGRLVLGNNTILRSTLEMALDENGVPMVDESDRPIVLEAGAIIDGSGLESAPYGEGIVIVGHSGLVERIWVDGGNSPGIEITSNGTVRSVLSTGHSIGLRIRAAGVKAMGTVESSLISGNGIYGLGVIGLHPDLDPPSSEKVDVQAIISRNTVLNNNFINLLILGGIGTDDGAVQAEVSHNVFRGGTLITNLRVEGGFEFQTYGRDNNSEVNLTLNDNLIEDSEIGIRIDGQVLSTGLPSDPLLSLK